MAALARIREVLTAQPATPDDQFQIPRLADDPTFAAASELLAAFIGRVTRLEAEKKRLDLERYLGARAVDKTSSTDVMLRDRLAEFQKLPPLTPLPATAPSDPMPSSAVAIGLEILAGGAAPPVQDHGARRAEFDRQIAALNIAIREQTVIVDEIADALSFRLAKEVQPLFDAANVSMFRAAETLAGSARRMRELRAAVVAAGIRGQSTILRTPNVRSPLMLGDPLHYDSEIGSWGRLLASWGLV